ncbi:MAG: alpha/beta fold hydrolase [Bacteroidetes bacterium]|nr:alpha/beta fold hydrolase [Bacteroidota bacterium]
MKRKTRLKVLKIVFGINRILIKVLDKIAPQLSGRLCARLFLSPVKIKARMTFGEAADHRIIKVNDKQVLIRIFGHSGTPILLAHGWSSNGSVFKWLIPHLTERGYRLIVPDFPANGSSSGKQTNIFEFVETISLLNQQMGFIKIYIGHSLGGLSVIKYLENYAGPDSVLAVSISAPVFFDQIVDQFLSVFGNLTKTRSKMILRLEKNFPEMSFNKSATQMINKGGKVRYAVFHDSEDPEVPIEDAVELANICGTTCNRSSGFGHTALLKEVLKVIDPFQQSK